MILHHKTSFVITEQRTSRSSRSTARAYAARERVAAWLAAGRADHRAATGGTRPAGLVLTSPGAVAWVTGGIAPPVDRTAGTDLVWAVITGTDAWLITTNVEASRIRAEYDLAEHGFADLVEVPWYSPSGFTRAAGELAGADAAALASDGHPDFGSDASDDLTAIRLELSAAEIADLTDLGTDAAHAVQAALTTWRPGERDLDIQARVAALLEATGADAPVLIVGGDDRVRSYRHPMAAGALVRDLAMVVVVARRAGLHVALTRFAAAAPVDAEFAALRDRVLRIEDAVLTACRPGSSYGAVLDELARGYAAAGAEYGWKGHYQGGPVGFAQREFEIAPGQTDSQWHGQPVAAGHAVAWNPSLPGGAKAEDTYLVVADGQLLRVTDAPGWPAEDGDVRRPPRPAVLEVAA